MTGQVFDWSLRLALGLVLGLGLLFSLPILPHGTDAVSSSLLSAQQYLLTQQLSNQLGSREQRAVAVKQVLPRLAVLVALLPLCKVVRTLERPLRRLPLKTHAVHLRRLAHLLREGGG